MVMYYVDEIRKMLNDLVELMFSDFRKMVVKESF